ncbi:MAG: hypothetical protein AB7S75_09430 [Desulfococcaceae bacterium]
MKHMICFIAALFVNMGFSADAAAQAVLRGRVVKDRIRGNAVIGAKVSSDGAKDFYTTENGMFKLEFQEKTVGERVELFCEKDGMEIVNEMDLEINLPKQPDSQTLILMC